MTNVVCFVVSRVQAACDRRFPASATLLALSQSYSSLISYVKSSALRQSQADVDSRNLQSAQMKAAIALFAARRL